MILDKIGAIDEVKSLNHAQLTELSREIRELIISTVEKNGGHLSPSLGAVDLITALCSVYDFTSDKIVFDVGHQAYAYKILCEGATRFSSLRQEGGTSGFTGDGFSDFDPFIGGHAGNSLSLALGCLNARDRLKQDYDVVAFIGDASFFNGENLEALFATDKKPKRFLIVFNDNGMSISPNANGAYKFLSGLSLKRSYRATKSCLRKLFGGNFIGRFLKKLKFRFKRSLTPNAVMEKVGFKYYGVYDGHDLKGLKNILSEIKNSGNSAFLHVRTLKGKGFEPAERDPERYHGIGKDFKVSENSFSNGISPMLSRLIKKHPAIVAITAGMKLGTGLSDFANEHAENFVDVGICEQHAVTTAGGMAIGGLKPVVCVYSTFLQRAYDQIMVDVCMKNLPVLFLIDRAGLVGSDGKTHQGVYDISILKTIPNLTILAPKDLAELELMADYALTVGTPVAIRYPNGCFNEGFETTLSFTSAGEWERVVEGNGSVKLLAVGPRALSVCLQAEKQSEVRGIEVINCRSIKPLDVNLLDSFTNCKVITVEENAVSGGFGESVCAYFSNNEKGVSVECVGVGDGFVSHASVQSQLEHCGISESNLLRLIGKV